MRDNSKWYIIKGDFQNDFDDLENATLLFMRKVGESNLVVCDILNQHKEKMTQTSMLQPVNYEDYNKSVNEFFGWP